MGDQASLSSFHKDLGIPINFQEVLGLVTFEELNSTNLLRCQEMWGPLSRWGGELGFSLLSPQRFRYPFILRDERRGCIQATSGKSDLISCQGISVSTLLEVAKSGSLSHTYCSTKAPLEVLLESLPTCSIQSWESAFFSRRFGLNRAFLEFLCWNWCS